MVVKRALAFEFLATSGPFEDIEALALDTEHRRRNPWLKPFIIPCLSPPNLPL